ncbi:hypothetical protein EIB18_01455 [Caulobacter vibrioides]|uniref:hypothetical protein n=1 Tax=Caulobacter vibrioides TaxID=155892 RepID=UPI000BB4EBA2|nr:hypothetical protein [Caulobacter vibrioides]ATC23292.1 hypothetical protein CA608_01460 [Caulobacter vibrioides]AZH11503.1 hypothetical protein EIB18_01455 [Caulobacter vibrioides]PLR13037.1 hypothetical protein CVUC_06810 [Caulobacter vibrioides]
MITTKTAFRAALIVGAVLLVTAGAASAQTASAQTASAQTASAQTASAQTASAQTASVDDASARHVKVRRPPPDGKTCVAGSTPAAGTQVGQDLDSWSVRTQYAF